MAPWGLGLAQAVAAAGLTSPLTNISLVGRTTFKIFHDKSTLLTEVENTRGHAAEVRVEDSGLICVVFTAHVQKVLSLFDPTDFCKARIWTSLRLHL